MVQQEPVHVVGLHATADPVTGLHDDDVEARLHQVVRGAQPGQARPHHDHVRT